jgi:Predicted membrane protein (DUF2243)
VTRRPLIAAGILIGVGLGGFLDGILFHQILQLHNMLSARIPPDTVVNIKINMVWDGLFHTLVWTMTAIGIGSLWRAARRTDVPWSGARHRGLAPDGMGPLQPDRPPFAGYSSRRGAIARVGLRLRISWLEHAATRHGRWHGAIRSDEYFPYGLTSRYRAARLNRFTSW